MKPSLLKLSTLLSASVIFLGQQSNTLASPQELISQVVDDHPANSSPESLGPGQVVDDHPANSSPESLGPGQVVDDHPANSLPAQSLGPGNL